MRLRVNQIKLNINESIEKLPEKIRKKTGLNPRKMEVVKESIDARDKGNIYKVYSVDFDVEGKNVRIPKGAELAPDMQYHPVEVKRTSKERPVVIGFGPAGMFAGLVLAQAGLEPVILERGGDVDSRTTAVLKFWNEGVLDTENNVQFGEGGAGTFSDGKLTTGIKDPRIRKVLSEMAAHGGPEEILYKAKPHIGTDILKTVVRGIREDIIVLGGEVRFNTLVTGLETDAGRITGVKTIEKSNGNLGEGKEDTIKTDTVILAIGHSSRDTFTWLNEMGISMTKKPFSMGLRIEHPQDVIDRSQYGKTAAELGLPVADYKLNYRTEDGRGVYTFCMCPGGKVITASSEEGMVVVNGMSYHDRNSGVANSAVLVDVRVDDFPGDNVLSGMELQRKYERLAYINGMEQARIKLGIERPYYAPNCTWAEFNVINDDINMSESDGRYVKDSLPGFVSKSIREAIPYFGRKIKGFDSGEAKLTAIEARSSSPVRFTRDENLEGELNGKTLKGFYPIGEGAGYAGGIMSAAVDGIRAAEEIIGKA